MNQKKNDPLVIKRIFEIDTAQLFQAWANPQIMEQWLFPFPAGGSVSVDNQFEVGGSYQLDMYSPAGDIHTMTGEYREIVPNEKIVFTWNTPQVQNTVVTVEFKPVNNGTELVLTHDFLPDADSRKQHTEGWEGCLLNLEKSGVKVT